MFGRLSHYLDLYFRAQRYRHKIDPLEIALIRRLVGPGQTVIDVGAHKGGYLYWLRKQVGPSGKVFAFEPQKELNERLTRALNALNWKNVTLESLGVSNVNQEGTFYRAPDRPTTGASLAPGVFAENSLQVPLRLVTLDAYLEQWAPTSVDFIKIDVESHELEVLQGARQTLQKYQPTLLFEGEKRMSGEAKIRECFAYLKSLGLRGYFNYAHAWHSVAEFDFAHHQDERTPNFPNSPNYANNFVFTSRPSVDFL